MCGIFLLLNNNINYSDTFINNQFLKGQHRGPEFSYINYVNDTKKNYIGFHRLAINGLDTISNQPIEIDNLILICNGEIYNYQELFNRLDVEPITNSDCEVIIHCYKKYGIEYTLQMLDGVFAFVLIDNNTNKLFVGRDPYGVRPIYYYKNTNNVWVFASELKQISNFINSKNDLVSQFLPSSYSVFNLKDDVWTFDYNIKYITNFIQPIINRNDNEMLSNIKYYLTSAVVKRIHTSDRPIACLLSGGLDSSLITSIVSKFYSKKLKTFSIGLKGSEDLKYARIVADYLQTDHTEIIVSEIDFFEAIPEVIEKIESYDTTTVRASVGNYLLGKYISENTDCKVIFNGDGSDELCGGYLYFHNCPDSFEFDKECKRLLNNIHYFDVLRSDRSISTNGLEPRTPFLDRTWVQYYLSIDPDLRNHSKHKQCEKFLLRKAFDNDEFLPKSVLWRTKEAFSDGVSSLQKSWYEIIQENIESLPDSLQHDMNTKLENIEHNKPTTKEQMYYRYIFEKLYSSCEKTIPHFWMPKYTDATDSSARTLKVYKNIQEKIIVS